MALSQQSLAPPLGLCYGRRLRPHISDQPPTLLCENLQQMTKTFHNWCKISGLCHLSSTFHQYIQILQPTLVISTKPSPNWEQLHMIKSSGEATWSCYTGGCPVVLLQQDGGKQVDEGGGADATPSLYVVVVCWWPVTNPNTEKAGKRKVLGHEHMCCRLWGANKSLYMCIVCLWYRVKFKGKHKITALEDMHFVQYFISFERDMLSQLRHAYNFPLSIQFLGGWGWGGGM